MPELRLVEVEVEVYVQVEVEDQDQRHDHDQVPNRTPARAAQDAAQGRPTMLCWQPPTGTLPRCLRVPRARLWC